MSFVSVKTFVVPDDSESISEDLEPSKPILLKDLNKSTDLYHFMSDLSLDGGDSRSQILNIV